MAHRAELIPLIRQVTVFKTTAQWVSGLEAAGVPCGPVNDLAQVFADPHVVARGLAIELPHALAGRVPQVASPIRLSETPVEYTRAPPLLGEHTAQVLPQALLGIGEEEITLLREAGCCSYIEESVCDGLFYIAKAPLRLISGILKLTVDALCQVSIIRPTSGADGNEKAL